MDEHSPDITVSSTCFKTRDLKPLLSSLCDFGFKSVELSGNINPLAPTDLEKIIQSFQNHIKIYFHNYYPTPFKPFVLNLASDKTHEQSKQHCLNTIGLCSKLGLQEYSLHAGLAFSPNPSALGKEQSQYKGIDLNKSRTLLFDACKEIIDYGHSKNVELYLENNVVAKRNCLEGKNSKYHFSDLDDTSKLLPLFKDLNIKVLLDVAHLYVSANTLSYDPSDFIDMVQPYIGLAHISENNGLNDENKPVQTNSWFWDKVHWEQCRYISLEVKGLSEKEMLTQVALSQEKVAESISRHRYKKINA